MKAFPPVTADLLEWAKSLTRSLSFGWSQLEYKDSDSRATQDGVILWDAAAGEVVVSDAGAWVALGGGGGATNLGYTAATRILTSDTGTDVTLPIVGADPGLMTAADKTKLDGIASGAQVNVATDLAYTDATRVLTSSTGTDVTLPLVTSGNAGLAPASGGGTDNFLRADATFALPPGTATTTLIMENRTSDPGSPAVGQLWIRTDL